MNAPQHVYFSTLFTLEQHLYLAAGLANSWKEEARGKQERTLAGASSSECLRPRGAQPFSRWTAPNPAYGGEANF